MLYLIILIILSLAMTPFSLAKIYNMQNQKGIRLAKKFVSQNNYSVTKAIDIPGYSGYAYFFIDDSRKYINYLEWKRSNSNQITSKTFDYKQILNCQIIKDDTIEEIKENTIEEISSKESAKKLGFRIVLNSKSDLYLDILILNSNVETKIDQVALKIKLLSEWVEVIKSIVDKNDWGNN